MFKIFLKVLTVLIFTSIFIYVLFNVPYPNSLTSATVFQLTAFFMPLFLSLTFTTNLFLKSLPSSVFISLGLILLLILQGLDSLNLVTGLLTIIAVYLLLSYFKKAKSHAKLTLEGKIPKLRLSKEANRSKLRILPRRKR